MFDWPAHSQTSPIRMLLRFAVVMPGLETVIE